MFDTISHVLHDPFVWKVVLCGIGLLAVVGTFAVLGSKEDYD